MAWTNPLTWVVGQLVTAAQLNTHIRDNELYLFGQKVEPGVVVDYAGSAAPSGWLLCDGSAVSRTGANAALFAAIGTAWGVGDGSTTFNVPDLRGRTAIGVGTGSGLTARALAATGGAETVALSTGEMPTHNHTTTESAHNHTQNSHNHSQNAHSHDMNFGSFSTSAGATSLAIPTSGIQLAGTYAQTASNVAATATNQAASTGLTINNNGSGTAHNNMQPWAALNKIIKL